MFENSMMTSLELEELRCACLSIWNMIFKTSDERKKLANDLEGV